MSPRLCLRVQQTSAQQMCLLKAAWRDHHLPGRDPACLAAVLVLAHQAAGD